jgi:hypothetical protein
MPTTFNVKMDRFYHLPHNAVLVAEFNFLVSKLNPETKHYKTKDLQRLFLVEQVRANKFKDFHPKPYRNFTEQDPPDKDKLRSKFFELENAPICPSHTIQEVYNKIQELGPEDALGWFLQNRRDSFARFVSDPETNYESFVMTPYTTQKQWKYNWAEFVRDYIQFLSYIGIIPAYYKGWGRENEMSGEAGFVISKLGEKYINGEISLPRMLMGYKYRNALVNLDNYPQYARKVRPFFAALQLLAKFESQGVNHIERNLLAGFVSCIMDEVEVDEIVRRHKRQLSDDANNNLQSIISVNGVFSKEIARFALTLSKFLIETGLIESNRNGRFNLLSISELGKQTLADEPKKIAVSNDVIGQLGLTPIIGYILKHFADSVRSGNNEVEIARLYESSELLKSIVDEATFRHLLDDLKDVADSPIEQITDGQIMLRDLNYQYSINSSADFSDIYDSNFVEGVPIKPHKQEIVRVERSTVLDGIVQRLTTAALASDGEAYENELYGAVSNLIGNEYAFQLGNVGSRAQRLSDTVWKVPILFDDEQKKLLVIFESKAGNAINGFDERKEKDDLKRTIRHFANELTEIAGIWYIVVDGPHLPENQHGGFRGGQSLSFEEKLQDIQHTVLSVVNKPVLVSAMNIHSFVEYYKYLFQITRQFGQTFTAFNDTVVQNFWIWGSLFHPVRSYSKIYNDHLMVKNTLRTTYAEQ